MIRSDTRKAAIEQERLEQEARNKNQIEDALSKGKLMRASVVNEK